jgi:hypothetical protein
MDPMLGQYVQKPLRRRKCYHVDPQTLEFVTPEEMKIKYVREYSFGSEIREGTLEEIRRYAKKPSYWDHSADTLKQVQEARAAREAAATHLAAQRGEADEESAAREAVVEAAMRAYRADAARGGFAAAVLDAACERLDAICAKKGAGRS